MVTTPHQHKGVASFAQVHLVNCSDLPSSPSHFCFTGSSWPQEGTRNRCSSRRAVLRKYYRLFDVLSDISILGISSKYRLDPASSPRNFSLIHVTGIAVNGTGSESTRGMGVTKQKPSCPLLDLAAELRLKIIYYAYPFLDPGVKSANYTGAQSPQIPPGPK